MNRLITVIFTLAALTIIGYQSLPKISITKRDPKTSRARTEIGAINAGVSVYHERFGNFPTGEHRGILQKLCGDNSENTVFFEPSNPDRLKNGVLLDPWKSPYRFDFSNPNHPKIWTIGPDRIDNHGEMRTDDIASWH